MQKHELEKLSVKEMRQISIREGFGISYLGQRKKAELAKLLAEAFESRRQRLQAAEEAA